MDPESRRGVAGAAARAGTRFNEGGRPALGAPGDSSTGALTPGSTRDNGRARPATAEGPDWLAAFAVEHGRPVAIPEWSDEFRTDGHGLGDDPSFIDNVAGWFVTNNVAFADVWSDDPNLTYRNNLLDGTFPRALARFRADFD